MTKKVFPRTITVISDSTSQTLQIVRLPTTTDEGWVIFEEKGGFCTAFPVSRVKQVTWREA